MVVGVCYSPWWTFAKLDGYVLAEVTSLLLVSRGRVSCCSLSSSLPWCCRLSARKLLLASRLCRLLSSSLAPWVAVEVVPGLVGVPRVSWLLWQFLGRPLGGLAVHPRFNGCPHCRSCTAVFAAFSGLRGARQVERFAACSFLTFTASSFPSWWVASEFFIALRSSRSRGLLRGGAYTDCAEQWSPGILSRPPPRKVGGRGASGVLVCVVTSWWGRVDP